MLVLGSFWGNKMKKIIILFLCGVSSVLTCEPLNQQTWAGKLLGKIGESSPVHYYSKEISTKMCGYVQGLYLYGDEPASKTYQDIGERAQCALCIAKHRQLPIKKLNQASPHAPFVGAVAEANAVFVNEEKMNQRTHGGVYCVMCHEAVHVKYADNAVSDLLPLGVFILAWIGGCKVLKACNITRLRKTTSLAVALVLSSYAVMQYKHFMERRADIEGHYATQCSSCVRESAQNRKRSFEEENNPLRDMGYLWANDLEKIAKDLGDKKCSYHNK